MEPLKEVEESPADEFLDELLPEELDWRRLVRAYPIPALLLAAAGGYVLGRGRGTVILAALSGFAADTLSQGVNEFLGTDVI
jgi:hypothetical protein